jgi:hypothetical protein
VPATRGSGYEPIEEPIRAELFSVERLEEHGRSLAEAQELSGRPNLVGLVAPRPADRTGRGHRQMGQKTVDDTVPLRHS